MLRSSSFLLAGIAGLAGCSLFFPSGDKPDPVHTSLIRHSVRVDSVGYVVGRAKVATIVLSPGMTTLSSTTAEVRRASDDMVVATCTVTGPATDPDTMVVYYRADFTPFDEIGEYYLVVPAIEGDLGKSANFRIGTTVFREALSLSMISFYGQRCGTPVEIRHAGQTFSHEKCHEEDAYLDYLDNTMVGKIKPSLGGWHDAGDYGKYITNGAFTVGMMFDAWHHFQPVLGGLTLPIPETGGALPDYLDEIKWELDWLLTTQRADGGVSHKVTALSFEDFNLMPEEDHSRRYYTAIGTSATADFTAVMAEAARIYRPYDESLADTYLAAARLGYQFLEANTGVLFPEENFGTGGYRDNSDTGERLWAAAELWETTGDPAVLARVEGLIWDGTAVRANMRFANNFDWADAKNLGLFTYVLSQREGRNQAIVDALTLNAIAVADGLVTYANGHAFGRAIGGYFWGSNGTVARASMNLYAAYLLDPKPVYLDAIAMQLDHLFGRNYYDRSQVTGVGYNPPMSPHHRPSAADDVAVPWPGLLVGGANAERMTADRPPAATWMDAPNDASLNENAINWNGALIYALAAMIAPPSP